MKDHAVILASFLTACLAAFSEISEVEVQFGGSVSLPCNSSAYGQGELHVQWEAMGKDVAFFQDGQLTSGPGYEGRVELQIPKALEGDFSLTLKNAVMSDTDMYECLWQGKRSISTVMLKVLPPPFPDLQILIREGEDVTLPCYAKIPKNKSMDKMFIQWLKDDKDILLLKSGEITTNSRDWHLALPSLEEISQGILSLTINAVTGSDQGVYRCLYTATDYEAPKSGDPEMYTLQVLASQAPTPLTEEPFDVTEMTSTSTSTELTDLISSASEDSTTTQGTVSVSSEMLPQSNTTTDYIGLIVDASEDATTIQDTIGEIFPQSNTTTDFTELIADGSVYRTTVQDTAGVISKILLQPSTTPDLTGFIAGDSDDSTTVQDTVEEMQPEPSRAAVLLGFIADDTADITTVQDTLEEILPQPSRATILFGFITDDTADSTTEEDTMEGEGTLLEFVSDKKMPWVRIGIISGVLLVTAAFMGTLAALGKL